MYFVDLVRSLLTSLLMLKKTTTTAIVYFLQETWTTFLVYCSSFPLTFCRLPSWRFATGELKTEKNDPQNLM